MYTVIDPSHLELETTKLAQWLLGKIICRFENDRVSCAGIIIETEAYLHDDEASHSYSGLSKRNASMFLSPGHWYVYQIYGVHHCLNVVSSDEGVGEAVLIRALYPLEGRERMRERRSLAEESDIWNLCSGPGKVCRAMGIDKIFDGTSTNGLFGDKVQLCEGDQSRIKELAAQFGTAAMHIQTDRRIGITKNRDLAARYFWDWGKFVSRR